MDTKKVNWLSLFFCLMLLGNTASAQQTIKPADGKDYSFLKFEDVNNFFKQKKISLLSADNLDLFFESFSWLGTPYRYAGKTYQGIDCSGFVAAVYDKVFHRKLSGSCKDIFTKCEPVEKEQLTEGDLVFFNIRGPLSHVGLYLGNNKFVHASVQGGVMVNDLDESYYKRYFYKVARLIE